MSNTVLNCCPIPPWAESCSLLFYSNSGNIRQTQFLDCPANADPEGQSLGVSLGFGAMGLCPALGFTLEDLELVLLQRTRIPSSSPMWEEALSILCCLEL